MHSCRQKLIFALWLHKGSEKLKKLAISLKEWQCCHPICVLVCSGGDFTCFRIPGIAIVSTTIVSITNQDSWLHYRLLGLMKAMLFPWTWSYSHWAWIALACLSFLFPPLFWFLLLSSLSLASWLQVLILPFGKYSQGILQFNVKSNKTEARLLNLI